MCENKDKTPGQQAINVMKDVNNEIIFKKPSTTPVKRQKQKILDEETYVDKIGKIIQRDFFPDLEKLKAQNEYLAAVERNDVTKMRELYVKYSGGKRPPTERMPSPATFETPANLHNSQTIEHTTRQQQQQQEEREEKRLSLDQFLNNHTSQDNQSFNEILVESDRKHKEKYSYLLCNEQEYNKQNQQKMELLSIEEQCKLPVKQLNIDTWNYKNENYIMYTPAGVALTPEQTIELNKRKQEINHCNTRLHMNPFNETQNKEQISELAKNQSRILDGKIGVDGKELLMKDNDTYLKTPSPHHLLNTPLMTWGEIDGTPFRLDGSDTPLPGNCQAFKMAEVPRREQLAMELAEKVNEKKRDKQKAMEEARKRLVTPKITKLSMMSPAAKRLATNQLKLNFDFYTPSPKRHKATTPATPKRLTTPKLNLGIKRNGTTDDVNLTDDLLKIDLPKRQKASDFF